MAFNFPASPTVGQQYAPLGPGGPTYRWDGEKWLTVATTSGAVQFSAMAFDVQVNGAKTG